MKSNLYFGQPLFLSDCKQKVSSQFCLSSILIPAKKEGILLLKRKFIIPDYLSD